MKKSTLLSALLAALLFAAASFSSAQNPPADAKEQAAKLVAILKSDAPQKDKADACRQLGVLGTKETVPTLAALLSDEKLSHMARYALEPLPDPAVDEAFRAALDQLKGRLLAGVIGSLGVRRDAKAVEPLTRFLQNADPDVAQAAARALGSIGTLAAAKALQAALPAAPTQNQLAFCEGLFRCAEAMSAQGKRDEAKAIYDQLRNSPGPHQVRAGALRGAILTRQQDAIPLLREQLRSNDYILFAAAIRAAQELPGTAVTEALAAELGQLPPDRQIVVLQTLGLRGDSAALPSLSSSARNSEKPVRLAAVRALAQISNASTVPILVGLMADPDRDLSQLAQESLASLPNPGADAAVRAMLGSTNAQQRLTGIELAGRRRMVSAVPNLLEAAKGSDPEIRPAALKQAGELGSPAELQAVLDLLLQAKETADLEAAEQALSALSAKAEPDAAASMLGVPWSRAEPKPRAALLRVMASLGGPNSLKTVRAALTDANPDVRTAATRALGGWKTADAAPDLLALAKNAANPTDKTLALRGYLRLAAQPDLPADQRLTMCRDAASLIQRAEEKKLLLAALGGIPSTDALAMIAPHLDDAATKEEACSATLALAEKLLQGQASAKLAPELIKPLEKAAQAGANPEMTRRANKLLRQAKEKAGVN